MNVLCPPLSPDMGLCGIAAARPTETSLATALSATCFSLAFIALLLIIVLLFARNEHED